MAPNFIAAVISVPLLTAIFDVVGIFGGYLIGVKLLGVSSGVYFGEMMSYVEMEDVLEGLFKSLNFGAHHCVGLLLQGILHRVLYRVWG